MNTNSNHTTIKEPQLSPARKALKKIGDRIGLNYVVLKSLKKSQKNDVVKCFYMKSIIQFGFCVIKEGSINDVKDRFGRDIRERLVWQQYLHQTIPKNIRIPGYIDSFEQNGNFYLAVEHINGKSLAGLFKASGPKIRKGLVDGSGYGLRILKYLIQCASILKDLHDVGIVHRDATAANFMISVTGKVYLIDLELCYAIADKRPTPPFLLGTHGYMPPEQILVHTPTIKEDVFAFGALLLSAWSNLPPVILTDPLPEDLDDKIKFFIKDQKILRLVTRCLARDADSRPGMETVIGVLKEYIHDVKSHTKRDLISVEEPGRLDIGLIIQSTINALSGPVFSDQDKGWFAENVIQNKERSSSISKGWYASFHIGGSGILYLLSKAKMLGYDVGNTASNVEKLISMIERKYVQPPVSRSGLHFGSHGIAVSIAYAVDSGILSKSSQWTDWIRKLIMQQEIGSLDIMNGVSGQIIASMIIYDRYPNEELRIKMASNVKIITDAQAQDGSWPPLSRTIKGKSRAVMGFAYGIAGVVYALLQYSRRFNDAASAASAGKGLAFLIKNAKWRGGLMYWTSFPGKKSSPWWRDGATGMAQTFLKAYEVTGSEIYKKYCEAILSEFSEETWSDNFGQTNGMTGLGEVYIEAYRIFGNKSWLRKAEAIGQILMMTCKMNADSGSYWLTENQYPLPGFMLGNSGVLHFLLRLLNCQTLGMPLAGDFEDAGINNRSLVWSRSLAATV